MRFLIDKNYGFLSFETITFLYETTPIINKFFLIIVLSILSFLISYLTFNFYFDNAFNVIFILINTATAIFLFVNLTKSASYFGSTGFRSVIDISMDDELSKHLYVHEAGHALVRACHFKKSLIINKISYIENDKTIFACVNNYSFWQNLILKFIKSKSSLNRHLTCFICAGAQAELAIFNDIAGLHGMDDEALNSTQDFYRHADAAIIALQNFFIENRETLIDLAEHIKSSDAGLIRYEDIKHIILKIKKMELVR